MKHERLQAVCEEIVDDVDGALGCALVDLSTGLPIAMDVQPGSLLNADAMELISAAGVTYFRDSVQSVPHYPDDADTNDGDYVQEIQTTTEDTYHFMSLVPGEGQELLILITDRGGSNLGLGWIAMRQAIGLVRTVDENGAPEATEQQALDTSTSRREPPQPTRQNPDYRHSRVRGRRTIWGQR